MSEQTFEEKCEKLGYKSLAFDYLIGLLLGAAIVGGIYLLGPPTAIMLQSLIANTAILERYTEYADNINKLMAVIALIPMILIIIGLGGESLLNTLTKILCDLLSFFNFIRGIFRSENYRVNEDDDRADTDKDISNNNGDDDSDDDDSDDDFMDIDTRNLMENEMQSDKKS